MADTLKSLPTKSQSFADIVKSGAIYADKTDTIAHIVTSMDNETEAKAVLLTRPKGFGKTLTISTLESILSKDRHKHFLNFGFVNNYQSPVAPRPVIRLDMGQANASEGLEEFKRSLRSLTFKKADELGVSTPDHLSPAEALDNLISSLSRKSWQQGIAILVDDYDQPLCDLALKPWREEGEKLLAGFYGELKYYDQRVSFILAAGVSAYHESGELSYLKNFADISRIPCCGWLCGFTHEELERYFGAHIEAAAKSLDMTPEKLFGVMQSRYEGYWFNGETGVYNPEFVLEFFRTHQFPEFRLGGPGQDRLAKLMIDSRLTVEELNDEIGLGYHGRLSRGELDVSAPRGALYRAGILALKTIFPPYSPNRWIHVCRYSNQEACEKLSRLWIAKFFKSGKEEGQALGRLRSAFASRDPGAVAKALNYFLARNPYDRHLSARSEKGGAPEGESQEGESQEGKSQEGKSQEGAEIPIRQQERFIRSSLLTILKAAGLEAQADIHEYLDRSELMVKADGLIWVFELEICQKEGEQEKTAEAALAKIQEKGLPEWLEYPSRAELFLAPTFDSTVPFWGDSQRAAGAEWTRVGRRWRPEPSEEASLLMGMAISREKRTIAAWKTEGGEPSQKPAQAPISG